MDKIFDSLNIVVDDKIKLKFKDFKYVEKLTSSHIGMILRGIKKCQNKYYRGGYIKKINSGVTELCCLSGTIIHHIYDDKYHLFVASNVQKQNHNKLRNVLEDILSGNSNLYENSHEPIKIIY